MKVTTIKVTNIINMNKYTFNNNTNLMLLYDDT